MTASPADDATTLARAWWIETTVASGSDRSWAERAWDDMGGSEPTAERAHYEVTASNVLRSGALAQRDARVLREAAADWSALVMRAKPPISGAAWLTRRAARIEREAQP